MNRLKQLLAAAVAVAWLCEASAAVGGELTINVSSFPPGKELAPGTAVLLSVEGLEDGQTPVWHYGKHTGDVVLKLEGYHLFAGTEAGPRTFIVQVPVAGQDPFATKTFDYGAEEDDDVNPQPTPVPPGEKTVVMVLESHPPNHDGILQQAKLGKWLLKQGIEFRREDPDVTENGQTPDWLSVVLAEVKAKGLSVKEPVLAVVVESSDGYSVAAIRRHPATLGEAQELLKKWGVEP